MGIEIAIVAAIAFVLWSASQAQSQLDSSAGSSGDPSLQPVDGSFSAGDVPSYDVIPVSSYSGTDATGVAFVDQIENISTQVNRPGIDEIVQRWAVAIQTVEGYTVGKPNITESKTGLTGSRAYRNNNPGNLRVNGDLGMSDGYGVFSSYDKGRQALINDLYAKIRKYPTFTVAQIMARYAPAADQNDPVAYAASISNALGVDVNTQMQDLGA